MSLQILTRQLSEWFYRHKLLVEHWRAARMRAMLRLVKPPPKARIVDLGGTEYIWNTFPNDFHVTLVNLPGNTEPVSDPGRFRLLSADACDLKDCLRDQCCDLAFSNSTIEHVGDEGRQDQLAAEIQRLAPAYWVQTPSDQCVIEPHTGVPFYWRLPAWMRDRLHRNWRRKLPGWSRMIEATRVLSRERMLRLFPGASVYVETQFGVEKSYAAYRSPWSGSSRS